jgi:hypothetical protein
MTEGAK